MQLGFVTAILPDLSLTEVLDFAAREKFDCVELMCWPVGKKERKYAGVTHLDVTEFQDSSAAHVQQFCREYKVSISALGYYPNMLSSNPEEAQRTRAHFLKVIDAAAMLGLSTVNTFVGRDPQRSMDSNLNTFSEVWPALIQHAESRNVRVGIENCPMLFTLDEWPGGKNLAISPEVWRKMFEIVPSPNFGLNFDPSHFVWQFMDYLQPLREFSTRLFHIHAKDLKIDRQKLNERGVLGLGWSIPKVPGLGEICWNQFISTLSDVGYQGPVCIEVEDDAFLGDLDRRKQALRIARNVLRPLIG